MSFEYQGIKITKYPQSAFLLEFQGKNIYIDPFQIPTEQPQADYILLTHEHFDHADPESINKILKQQTVIVANELATNAIMQAVEFDQLVDIEPGINLDLGDFQLETTPAYNSSHPRENNGVGLILHLGEIVIYHAGDTDNIPELMNLYDIDIAMFPISGTYVATAKDAAAAIKIIKPKVVIPMHHDAGIIGGREDVTEFKEQLNDFDVEVYDFGIV